MMVQVLIEKKEVKKLGPHTEPKTPPTKPPALTAYFPLLNIRNFQGRRRKKELSTWLRKPNCERRMRVIEVDFLL
jgi:hypothetical protein